MRNLFIRIFGGIFLSILVVISAAYLITKQVNSSRYYAYLKDTTQLTSHLIFNGIDRQPTENRDKWIKLVSSLTGLEIDFIDDQQTRNLRVSNDLYRYTHKQVAIEYSRLTDKLISATAFLALNELGQYQVSERTEILNKLNSLANYKLERVNKADITLSSKELRQLNRGETVLVRNTDIGAASSISAYSPWGNTNDLLKIGPVSVFQQYPVSILFTALSLSLMLIAAVIWSFLIHLRNRVAQIQYTVDNVASNGQKPSAFTGQPDTISELKHKTEQMAERIESLLEEKNYMVRAISHDLRTPIAKVHFRLEKLARLFPENRPLAKVCREDLARLDSLIDELLTYESLSLGQQGNLQLCDIQSLIAQEVEDAALLYAKLSFQLHNDVSSIQALCVNSSQIERLISNLLANAAKYAENTVKVKLYIEQDSYFICISDDGIGVQPELLDKLFEPFFKVDSARTHNSHGHGLGLAICKQIVEFHLGEISAINGTDSGLQVTIRLPIDHELMSTQEPRP